MDFIPVLLVIFAAILVCIYHWKKKERLEKFNSDRMKNSTLVAGEILAVERQTQHERARTKRRLIKVKVRFTDPVTEEIETTVHEISRFTPDLHSYIAGAVGIVSVGGKGFKQLAARRQQLISYREKLLSEGKSEEFIKKELERVALKMASSAPGGLTGAEDSDGYLVIPNPINVDLYFGKNSTEETFLLVFKPEEELASFREDYFH